MSTVEVQRQQKLPGTWEVPQELRERFGNKSGRQRSHEFHEHLVIMLHLPPRIDESTSTLSARPQKRHAVYFWRHNLGEWSCSEGRHGVETLLEHIIKYEDAVESLEGRAVAATSTSDWFEILAVVAPLRRNACNMADALQSAQQHVPQHVQAELQDATDAAIEVARDAELLQEQAQHSIDFLLAQQQETQALASEAQVETAYRLNVIAAVFLPLATITSVFGMNLPNGLENSSRLFFWLVIFLGLGLGLGIGAKLVRLRSWKPAEW